MGEGHGNGNPVWVGPGAGSSTCVLVFHCTHLVCVVEVQGLGNVCVVKV